MTNRYSELHDNILEPSRNLLYGTKHFPCSLELKQNKNDKNLALMLLTVSFPVQINYFGIFYPYFF